MKRFNGRHLAVAVVVIANIMALRHAAANRSEGLESEIELTDLELRYQRQTETSAVFLNLTYSPPQEPGTREWVTEQELRNAGFDLSIPVKDERARKHYARQSPRRVIAAFEYAGPAWNALLEARAQLDPEDKDRRVPVFPLSKLVPVGIGPDIASVRARFPDRTKVILLPCVVRLWPGDARVHANLTSVPARIHVPREFAQGFKTVPDQPSESKIRYRVQLRFGANLEPRVAAVVFPR